MRFPFSICWSFASHFRFCSFFSSLSYSYYSTSSMLLL
ncbi:hypothetical protein CR513_31526 [Mucuna pruriens]|uniref:Uncharacterized protein n=1 Tax=Mucuna pruriens TaxID=157652 RepID=A0A371G929_MUCPR|nr:hypothetical protein CR513_31526 [Mucuna pruriens]